MTLQYIQVFARTSPNQKDFIVGKLNALGLTTLMCGDGTNDVGSLKRSHCGVAVINKPEPTKQDKKKFSGMMSMYLKPQEIMHLSP